MQQGSGKAGLEKVRQGEYAEKCHELAFAYDGLNRLVSVSDRTGAKAAYTYDCLGQKTGERFRISPYVERIVRYRYDLAGNMTEKAEGIEERFLKPGGRRSTVWAVTRYEYDKNGNCTRSVIPNGYERGKTYDTSDRVIQEEERDRSSGIHRIYQYEYDGSGNLVKRLDKSLPGHERIRGFRYDGKGRLTHLTDEAGATTRVFYDRNDRITKVVRPDQSVLKRFIYDYSGNLKTILEGGQVYTEYDYDLAGNPVAVYAGREKAAKKAAAQRLTYDARGNITGVEDGNRNRTKFVLDAWGRITEIHTPEGGVERYTYDYAGNITGAEDTNGGLSPTAITAWARYMRLPTRRGLQNPFTAIR